MGSLRKVKVELTLTEEHQDGANPLHRTHDIAKQKNGAKDGEELPRGGDNGAGQRPKVHHCHEDEGLVKELKKKKKNTWGNVIWIYTVRGLIIF